MVGPPSWVVIRLEDGICWAGRIIAIRRPAAWHVVRPVGTCVSRTGALTPSFASSHTPKLANDPHCGAPEHRLPDVRLRIGGEMLVKVAFVLLAVWLLGLFGVYGFGDLFHVFLLVGLMLLLLAFLRARDAAVRRSVGETKKTS
jgi:hypothetical protein